MGLLDKFKKGGGGFLNGVDGLIKALVFTNNPDFDNDGSQLWAKLTIRQAGAAENISTHVRVASDATQFVIGDDGTSLEPVEGAGLYSSEPFSVLYASAVEAGLDDPDIEDGEALQFGHLVGARVRFEQVKDVDGMASLVTWLTTKPAGKAALKAGKYNDQGQKKGKDGKYYDQKQLHITKVYETGLDVEDVEVAPVKKSTNGSGKTMPPSAANRSSATTTAKKQQAAAELEAELSEFARETLVAILGEAKNNSITTEEINIKVVRAAKDHPLRDSGAKWLKNTANLESLVEQGVIELATKGRNTVISLAA